MTRCWPAPPRSSTSGPPRPRPRPRPFERWPMSSATGPGPRPNGSGPRPTRAPRRCSSGPGTRVVRWSPRHATCGSGCCGTWRSDARSSASRSRRPAPAGATSSRALQAAAETMAVTIGELADSDRSAQRIGDAAAGTISDDIDLVVAELQSTLITGDHPALRPPPSGQTGTDGDADPETVDADRTDPVDGDALRLRRRNRWRGGHRPTDSGDSTTDTDTTDTDPPPTRPPTRTPSRRRRSWPGRSRTTNRTPVRSTRSWSPPRSPSSSRSSLRAPILTTSQRMGRRPRSTTCSPAFGPMSTNPPMSTTAADAHEPDDVDVDVDPGSAPSSKTDSSSPTPCRRPSTCAIRCWPRRRSGLARVLKRAVSDEQNEVLDRCGVLPKRSATRPDDPVAASRGRRAFTEALRPDFDAAVDRRRASSGPRPAAVSAE